MNLAPFAFLLLSVLPAVVFIVWIVWLTVAVSDIRRELRAIRQALSGKAEP